MREGTSLLSWFRQLMGRGSEAGEAVTSAAAPEAFAANVGPIVLMGFNRPDYLRQVIASLLAQQGGALDHREFHLFQDGAVNRFSGERYANDEDIQASVDIFREMVPQGVVHQSPDNIGVALNFERAERYVFLERGFPSAMLFEDDMVLGPYYVDTLQRLLDFAASPAAGGRVGYVAAYGMHRASSEQQEQRQQDIVEMGHAWGYAVNRDHWLDVREVIDPYIQVVEGFDYRQRPKAHIGGVHKSLGVATRSLSQDAMKMLATSWLGRVRLMPFVCQARYIGETGLNFTPEAFQKKGYGREVLFDRRPDHFDWPSIDALIAMNRKERDVYEKTCAEAYGERDMPPAPGGRFKAADHR